MKETLDIPSFEALKGGNEYVAYVVCECGKMHLLGGTWPCGERPGEGEVYWVESSLIRD